MMKPILIFLGVIFSIHLSAQTGIGTTAPNASAKLDVYSDNKGFLPPRVSLTDAYDRTTIPSPATGLLVYCKGDAGLAAGYYFWNGNAWATIATEGGSGSVAAEYGTELLASATFSVPNSTRIDILSFNLPSAGTWEVIYFMRGQNATQGFAAEFALYDASNVLVPNSEILGAYGENSSTGTGVVRITTTGPATYKLKAWASTGSYSVISDNNGRTGVTWKKISGNAPVTGQSVDYVSTSLNSNITGVGSNTDIKLQQLNGGNIPYNPSTGVYSLSANKTYILQAQLRVSTASTSAAYLAYTWVDAVSNVELIINSEALSSSNTSGAGFGSKDIVQIIYTPTSNQTVKLRSITSVGTQTIWLGTASIIQIGSSAIVNPWILSGNNSYNTTGNVGIGTNAPTTKLDVTGDVNVTGNLNVTAGSASANIAANALLVGNSSGDEGGEIQLAKAATNTTIGNKVIIDVYRDKLRLWEGGASSKGVNIDLSKAPDGVGGELVWKKSGLVNAGTYLSLDNLKVSVTTENQRGLSIGAVSTNFTANISGYYAMNGGVAGTAINNVTYTTTPSASFGTWHFPTEGDGSYYNIFDKTNNRFYRVNLLIGSGYNNNVISIERLF